MKNYREIIIAPLLTEKSIDNRETILAKSKNGIKKVDEAEQRNRYFFKVSLSANKIEIRKAVEMIFSVKVVKINTLRKKGKMKRVRGFLGKQADWKKAMVTLAAGQTIPDFDIV